MAKIRAVVYTRVSTNKEEQKTSLDNQEEFYTNYCKQQGYELAPVGYEGKGIYADEGTATSVRKRPEFITMMEDAGLTYQRNNQGSDLFNQSYREPKFDLIIVKDASRFMRNTELAVNTVNRLRDKNVVVLFENAGVRSDDEGAEMIIPILFSMAQNESANMSKRIKFTKKMQAKKGIYNPTNPPYGYHRVDGKIVPHPEESKVVKRMFDVYAEGEKGSLTIANMLNDEGIKTKRGLEWSQIAVARLIRNKVYTGCPIVQKTSKKNVTDTRQTKIPEKDTLEIPYAVTAIVSLEQWTKVQKIMDTRWDSERNKPKHIANHKYYGKIFCACGGILGFSHSDKGSSFICANRRHKKTCKIRGITVKSVDKLFDLIALPSLMNEMGNYVYRQNLINGLNTIQQTIEGQRKALTSRVEELAQEKKEAVQALLETFKESSEEVRKGFEENIEGKAKLIKSLNEQLDNLSTANILKVREQVERKTEIIEAIKSKQEITDDEKLKLLKRIEVDDYQVKVEFSLPSYQEEVEAFNQFFPDAKIKTDYLFDSMTHTIKRQHKESKIFWETLEEDLISAQKNTIPKLTDK